jgi:hypothetical protein
MTTGRINQVALIFDARARRAHTTAPKDRGGGDQKARDVIRSSAQALSNPEGGGHPQLPIDIPHPRDRLGTIGRFNPHWNERIIVPAT